MSITSSKLAAALAFLLLILALLPFAMDEKRFKKSAQIAFLLENQKRITDLALGDSHSRALIFQELEVVGISFQIGGASAAESFEMFQNVDPYLPNLKRVWIPVSPTFFFRGPPQEQSHSSYLPRSGAASLRLASWRERLKSALDSPKYLFLDLWKGKLGNRRQRPEFVAGIPVLNQVLNPEFTNKKAKKSVALHLVRSNLSADNSQYIQGIIDLAKEREMEVVFYFPPYCRAYFYAEEQAEFRKKTYRLLAELEGSADNVVVIDDHDLFSTDQGERAELFNNPDHLNWTGGQVYSRSLYKRFKGTLLP